MTPLRAADASPVTVWADEELRALEARGLRRHLEPLVSPQGAVVRLDGGETLINFSANDYLGLAGDARLARAAAAAMEGHGVGTGASRLVVGDTTVHHALEARIALWLGTESALLFNSGYAANVGVLSSLFQAGDVIFSDALNHASIIDGCRLSRAKTVVYPHGDVAALAGRLREHPGRRRVVVTDAVFSMDGDLAPLRELVALCREQGVALMVDEAHAIGVFGPKGEGLSEALGVAGEVDIRMGTLGKAIGASGAFVAGSRVLTELLYNRARSLVFSTALPAALCAAGAEGLEVLEAGKALRERLWRNVGRFAEGLRRIGLPAEPRSPIFPVVVGAPEAAVAASRFLRARGVLAKPIRPPTVPEGTSRLRFALSAAHEDAHLDQAIDALKEWMDSR